MTLKEAARFHHMKYKTLQKAIERGTFKQEIEDGLARRTDEGIWLITRQAMIQKYGEPPYLPSNKEHSKEFKTLFTPMTNGQFVAFSLLFFTIIAGAIYISPLGRFMSWLNTSLVILIFTIILGRIKHTLANKEISLAHLIYYFEVCIRRCVYFIRSAPHSEKILLGRLVIWSLIFSVGFPPIVKEFGHVFLDKGQVLNILTILKGMSALWFMALTSISLYLIIKNIIIQDEGKHAFKSTLEILNSNKVTLHFHHKNGKCFIDFDTLLNNFLNEGNEELYNVISSRYSVISNIEWQPYGKTITFTETVFKDLLINEKEQTIF